VFKLNYNNSGNLVSDEGSDIALPSREWELLHDNVMLNKTIVVRTSTGGTGITITDFTTQSGSKPWKTKLVFGSTVNAGRYYITYYSQGDQNDADDLNTLAGSVNELVQTIGPFSGIQTELDAIQQSVNKVESEVNINSVLQKSVDTVQSTVSVIPTVQSSILNAITGLKTDVDSTIAKEQTLNSSIASLQSSIASIESVQNSIVASLNQLNNRVQQIIDMGGTGGGTITNTAPNISSSFTTVSALTTDIISIPYTIYDSEGGTLTANYIKDGSIITADVSTGLNTWDIGTLSAGDHTLSIWIKDSGNLASNTLTFNISVASANTAPIITSSYNPIAVDDRTSVSIPYTITDIQGGTLTATYVKDGVISTSTVSTGSNAWNVGTLGIGNHTLTINVKDNGNLTSNTLTFNISVVASNGAPTISSSFNATGVLSGTSISIPYTVSDAEDSTFIATYTIDSSSTASTVGSSAVWNVGTLPIGSHTLTIKVKDGGNLSSNTLTFNITVVASNTAPAISSSFNSTSVLTTDSISIPYTVTDALGGTMTATYTKDGSSSVSTVTTGSNTWGVGTLSSGSHTLTITVTDSGGLSSNVLTFNITSVVPGDITPPQQVGNLTANTSTENSVTTTWSLSPSGDVANYEVAYAINTATPNYVVASNVINPSSTSYIITGLVPDTDYIIKVVAIDTSGNRSTPVTATKRTAVATDSPSDGVTGGGTFTGTLDTTVDGGAFNYTAFSFVRDGGAFVVQTTSVDGGVFGDTTTSNLDGGTFGGTDTGSIDGGTF
jgi:hypothetical protein